ncbi:MAG: hypothetical protein AAFN41_07725 [Planctomycetota bacterium]
MNSNANEATHTTCVECSIPLPLHLSKEPGTVRVRCRFCGALYRGVLLTDGDAAPHTNIEIVQDDELRDPDVAAN